MKQAYKNKRDLYKAKAEHAEAEVARKQMVLDSVSQQFADYKKKVEEEKSKRWSATVYCENCLHVNSVSIPAGVRIDEGDCVTCRVRGKLRLVIEK